jgi:septum formation protein
MRPVWLASGSPRRRELLEWAGVAVEVRPAGIDEARLPGELPVSYARRLAEEKAATGPDDRVVLAADTVVHLDGAVLDKPSSRGEAVSHLLALSGRAHAVTTGVALRGLPGGPRVTAVTTIVAFRPLSRDEVVAYVATGDADDKAGAYGIQGRAGSFVARVEGSWTNVVGLPLEAVLPWLREAL